MSRSKATQPPVPAALADLALVDGPEAAAAGRMSQSKFLEEVRAGRAPAPVVKRPRFTRWRAADVRAWLASLGQS